MKIATFFYASSFLDANESRRLKFVLKGYQPNKAMYSFQFQTFLREETGELKDFLNALLSFLDISAYSVIDR